MLCAKFFPYEVCYNLKSTYTKRKIEEYCGNSVCYLHCKSIYTVHEKLLYLHRLLYAYKEALRSQCTGH